MSLSTLCGSSEAGSLAAISDQFLLFRQLSPGGTCAACAPPNIAIILTARAFA